jgi:nitrite reductase/ring-hydroxylating ferredoxin subunit
MTRYEFLKSCGFTGGALFALLSCVEESDSFVEALTQNPDGSFTNPDGTPVDDGTAGAVGPDQNLIISTEDLEKLRPLYRVDITSPLYTRLQTRNNYVVLGNTFVLALSRSGAFIAATVVCSHENNRSVQYRNGEWYCPQHGARYTITGQGLNDYGKNGIKVYKTAFDGQTVVIYE